MKQELRSLKRDYESARQDLELKESEFAREREQMKATIDALTLQVSKRLGEQDCSVRCQFSDLYIS